MTIIIIRGDFMKKTNYNEELFDFINKGSCAFTCINNIKEILSQNGYTELYEGKIWNINTGKYFVIRNDASIIAFNIGKKHNESFIL